MSPGALFLLHRVELLIWNGGVAVFGALKVCVSKRDQQSSKVSLKMHMHVMTAEAFNSVTPRGEMLRLLLWSHKRLSKCAFYEPFGWWFLDSH